MVTYKLQNEIVHASFIPLFSPLIFKTSLIWVHEHMFFFANFIHIGGLWSFNLAL